MNETREDGKRFTPSMSDSERNLWSSSPLLGRKDAGYGGDLFSEVWADGFVCLAMSDPRLIGPALAAMTGSSPLTSINRALPERPVMMDRPDAEFLGRVIVEFWPGKPPLLGTFGSDVRQLLELTEARLKIA